LALGINLRGLLESPLTSRNGEGQAAVPADLRETFELLGMSAREDVRALRIVFPTNGIARSLTLVRGDFSTDNFRKGDNGLQRLPDSKNLYRHQGEDRDKHPPLYVATAVPYLLLGTDLDALRLALAHTTQRQDKPVADVDVREALGGVDRRRSLIW